MNSTKTATTLKRFKNGQRIKVQFGPLEGERGYVRRCRIGDDGAWVAMDSIPKEHVALFPFSADESDSRSKHTLLYPEDCVEAGS